MGVSQNYGYFFGDPHNKDCILGGPILVNYHMNPCGKVLRHSEAFIGVASAVDMGLSTNGGSGTHEKEHV